MKKILVILLSAILSTALFGQDITGQWNGLLKVQGTQLRVVFNVSKTDAGYSATMDSPDQGAKGIPVTNTVIEGSKVKFEVASAKIEYSGEWKDDEIVGTFKQSGREIPMNLSRKAQEKEPVRKPQEPIPPFPYASEEVIFQNPKANVTLSGTLTFPKEGANFPVAILISGSGPQSREEELMGHKPFLVLSDFLTKNGIAVLRYDDRGVGQSTGDFRTATSADFATDVESAIAYLKTRKEINNKKIGLIGHSEGGLIAPLVASKSKDVGFIVLLAGPGIQGNKLLLIQQELIAKANGVPISERKKSQELNARLLEMVVQSKDEQKLKSDLTNLINESLANDTGDEMPNGMPKSEYVSLQVGQISSPWMQYFLKCKPAEALGKVKCPVLALNGEKDLQVPPKENLEGIKKALKKAGNKKVTAKEIPNLNHLFQECKTGSPIEYSTIEQTISPTAMKEILEWLQTQVIKQ
jgi:pimeloyl-ACP methyl ester carboxylesterase